MAPPLPPMVGLNLIESIRAYIKFPSKNARSGRKYGIDARHAQRKLHFSRWAL